MTSHEREIKASARRLLYFLKNGNIPRLIRQECRLFVHAIAARCGSNAVRGWVDETVDACLALMDDPRDDCPECHGIGLVITDDGEDPPCAKCSGCGLV